KACTLARLGPRRATNRGSHSRRRPTSRCTPTSMVSGPPIAPPTPGIGMKAGRVDTSSSIPNTWRLRPARMSSSRSWSPASLVARASYSSRVPGTPWPAACLASAVSSAAMVHDALHAVQQQLVHARAVEVDHLDAPAVPVEVLAHVRDSPELRDHHAGGGVIVVFVLGRQGAAAEQFAHGFHRDAAVDQQRAILAGCDLRDRIRAFAALVAA